MSKPVRRSRSDTLRVKTNRAEGTGATAFEQNSPYLEDVQSSSDLFLQNLATSTANQEENIFAEQPPSFGVLTTMHDDMSNPIMAGDDNIDMDDIKARVDGMLDGLPFSHMVRKNSAGSDDFSEAGDRAVILPGALDDILDLKELDKIGEKNSNRDDPLSGGALGSKHKSSLSADLLKRVSALRNAPKAIVDARKEAIALFDSPSSDADKSDTLKSAFALLTSEPKSTSKNLSDMHQNPSFGDEGPSGLLEPPDFDASIVQGSDVSGSFQMHGHIYDISSLSDANGRDSAAPSGDVLTDEDVHRLLHSGNSKETRIFSELRRMIENVDESNKEMLRLREQFTERQRMEEFMEKKLTSVELKAADLRFTVMKENESLPYSRRAGYNDRPARCSNTPAIGLTPSHSDSKNLPPSRQLPPWRPSMPSLPPSPPPGEQVNTDAKPLRSRTRSASLPLTSSQSDQPDNQPPIEVNERRASILPNMSMLVQRIPGWFAGTKYAPPTATVIAGQRRQWSEFYAMGMNWLRPFIIEITPDNDDSVEGTSVLRRSHQGQAWLVRALTSTYGSIALLLVLLLELWLLTSSIHQIGLRAIALDPVHSEEYEQQFYGGGSYHDSLLPT